MISTTTSRINYTGNGATTVFAIPFLFLENSHIVIKDTDTDGVETELVLGVDYTLTGAGSASGGEATLTVATVLDHVLSILRVVPMTQLVDYIDNDAFPAQTHEAALDKLTMLVQQVNDALERTLKYPTSEDTSVETNFTFAPISERPNTLVGFDGSGNLVLLELDPDTLELIAPVLVDTANLADGAVTTQKLAASLDFSGKTITYKNNSISAAKLLDHLDFSAKTIEFPQDVIHVEALKDEVVVTDKIRPNNRFDTLALNDPTISMQLFGTAGDASGNPILPLAGIMNGKNYYESGNLRLYHDTLAWILARLDLGTTRHFSEINTDVSTPDQVVEWETSPPATGTLDVQPAMGGVILKVTGTVAATSFSGSASGLTGIPLPQDAQISTLTDFAAGCTHYSERSFYGITPSGNLRVCGLNTAGKLGIGDTAASVASPRFPMFQVGADLIDGVTINRNAHTDAVVKVFARHNCTFVLTASGILYAAGDNTSGQLGQGDTTDRSVFTSIRFGASSATNKAIVDFSVSDGFSAAAHCLAIDEDGQVWVWGENGHGQLGINTTTDEPTPIKLSASTALNAATFVGMTAVQVVAIAGDRGSSYILFDDGTCWSTGRNQHGQLGDGTTTDAQNFAQIGAFTNIEQIWGGGDHNAGGNISHGNLYVRLDDNTIYGCGSNAVGQIGDGTTVNKTSLTQVTGLGAVSAFYPFGGRQKWCFAVKSSDGTARAWGSNSGGQLGDTSTTDRSSIITPTGLNSLITANGGILKVMGFGDIADASTAILFNNGKIYCCGNNAKFQLGLGHDTDPVSTLAEGSLSHPDNEDIGATGIEDDGNFLVRRADNTIWGCGYNGVGMLATGDDSTAHVCVASRMKL